MVYLDTNVLIYASVEQDLSKKETALRLIQSLAERSELQFSVLVLQEFVFTMAKLATDENLIKSDFEYYSRFIAWEVAREDFIQAVKLGLKLKNLKNMNDLIHLKIAERFCTKLVTFDRDFKELRNHTDIEIDILN